MATPEQHPTWLEMLFGGGFLAVVIPKCMEYLRSASILRRRDAAEVRVAEIGDEAKFRAELLARVMHLETQQAANITQINRLENEQNMMRRQLEGILMRGEAAIGGEPSDVILALRQTLYELRALLGHPPYPQSVIMGDAERKLGDG
jgi:hypothetical protein